MSRNRKSARDAGSAFERSSADYLAAYVDDRIDRRVKNGTKDRGDIGGVRAVLGGRVVLECKNTAALSLGAWVGEADIERGNDDAVAGFVVHKRRGTTDPGSQYVTGTLRDLVALLTGTRPPGELARTPAASPRAKAAAALMPGTVPLPGLELESELAENPDEPTTDEPTHPEGNTA